VTVEEAWIPCDNGHSVPTDSKKIQFNRLSNSSFRLHVIEDAGVDFILLIFVGDGVLTVLFSDYA
jgi:hypothetical protein